MIAKTCVSRASHWCFDTAKKKRASPIRLALSNLREVKRLLFRRLCGCRGAAVFALLVLLVLGLRLRFRLGGGRVLRENSGTGEKRKAKCGGCDGLPLSYSPMS